MFPEAVDITRFHHEIELAQSIQQNLLPASTPVIAGLDVSAVMRPHYPIGGDFYDFLLDRDQVFTFIVSDICGEGISAAMMMTMTRLALRIGAGPISALSPEEIFTRSNEILYDDFSRTATFASTFIGRYNPSTRSLIYANAGHSPVIFMPAGGKAQLLIADGAPIGVLPVSASKNHHQQLSPGDLLVVGTDGLVETYASGSDLSSGYWRLLKETERLADQPAKIIADCLFNPLQDFDQPPVQKDDQTLVVIKCA